MYFPGFNLDFFILNTYNSVMFFIWTSTYSQIFPHTHIVIISKTPSYHKSKEFQGPELL